MTQQVIVYIIGIVAVVYVGFRIWNIVRGRRNPCAGCGGCDLRDEFRQKQKDCEKNSKGNPGCGCGCG